LADERAVSMDGAFSIPESWMDREFVVEETVKALNPDKDKPPRFSIKRGGEGSGHFEHEGRPGEVGGSLPSGEIAIDDEDYEWKPIEGEYALATDIDQLVKITKEVDDEQVDIEIVSGPERGGYYDGYFIDDLEEPDYDLLELWTADDIDSTVERAKEIFGLTEDWSEAGYILDDGEMLDFSGKNQGGPAGTRSRDHREIGQAFVGDKPPYTEGMVWFMDKANAIRTSYQSGDLMIDFAGPPTRAQRELIESIGMQSEAVYWDVSRWYDADPDEGTKDRFITIDSGETSSDLEEIEAMLEGIRGIYYSPDYEERSWVVRTLKQIINILRGGEGSGHHGHAGRPGEVGGSLPRGATGSLFTEHELAAIPKVKQLIENDQDILTDEQIARWNPETYNRFSFTPELPRETELAKEAVRRFYQRTGIAPEGIHFTDIWKIYVPEMLDAQGETILSPNAEAFIRQYAQQHRERLGGAYLPTKDLIFVNTDKSGLGTYEGDETMWHEIAHAVERDFKLSENEVVEPGNRYFSRMVFEYGYEGDDVGAEYVADLITSHVRGPVMVDDDGDVGEKYVFGRGDNQIIFSERDNQNRKTIIENLLLWSVPYMEQDMMEEIVVERAGGGRIKYVLRPEGWVEGLWVEDEIVIRGGPGSGHHGHRGRPGQIGGSLPAVSGECYMASARWIMDEGKAIEDEAMLVHGTVAGQGPLEGLRIGHAWVEFGDLVYDASAELLVRKERYYEIGKVKDTVEYTPTEMRVNLLKTENWGPWDDRFVGGPWVERGGAGSGHHDHEGRPGEVGGSLPAVKISIADEWPEIPAQGKVWLAKERGGEDHNPWGWAKSHFSGMNVAHISELDEGGHENLVDPSRTAARGMYGWQDGKTPMVLIYAESYYSTFDETLEHVIYDLYDILDEVGHEGPLPVIAVSLNAGWSYRVVKPEHWMSLEVMRGGPGSGHHGHEGRLGEVGGSLPSDLSGIDPPKFTKPQQGWVDEFLDAMDSAGADEHIEKYGRVYEEPITMEDVMQSVELRDDLLFRLKYQARDMAEGAGFDQQGAGALSSARAAMNAGKKIEAAVDEHKRSFSELDPDTLRPVIGEEELDLNNFIDHVMSSNYSWSSRDEETGKWRSIRSEWLENQQYYNRDMDDVEGVEWIDNLGTGDRTPIYDDLYQMHVHILEGQDYSNTVSHLQIHFPRQFENEIARRLPYIERGGPGSGHHGHEGRQGEVGGSLPSGEAGGADAEKQAAGFPLSQIERDMENIRKKEKEVGYFYTSLGGRVGPLGGNNPWGIAISDKTEKAIKNLDAEGIDVLLIHNHPSGGSFSDSDIMFAVKMGIDEMRVSHPWGWGDYIMRINNDAIEKSVFLSDVIAHFASVKYDKFKEIQMAIPEYADRYSEQGIHESDVKASGVAWTQVAERWPDWFEYSEVEHASNP